jgi:hypothetical protein
MYVIFIVYSVTFGFVGFEATLFQTSPLMQSFRPLGHAANTVESKLLQLRDNQIRFSRYRSLTIFIE